MVLFADGLPEATNPAGEFFGEAQLRELVAADRGPELSDGVFAHLAHHRGQLTVYLRLNDVPVPAI